MEEICAAVTDTATMTANADVRLDGVVTSAISASVPMPAMGEAPATMEAASVLRDILDWIVVSRFAPKVVLEMDNAKMEFANATTHTQVTTALPRSAQVTAVATDIAGVDNASAKMVGSDPTALKLFAIVLEMEFANHPESANAIQDGRV